MMLRYATDSLEGTYCLLKLTANRVVKSRNVHWLDKIYGEYIKNARAKQIIEEESDDFEDSSKDESQNQGAGYSKVERDDALGAGQEGQTEEPVGPRTRSKKLQASFHPSTTLNMRATNKL